MITLSVLIALLVASAVIPTSMTFASVEEQAPSEEENKEQTVESQDDSVTAKAEAEAEADTVACDPPLIVSDDGTTCVEAEAETPAPTPTPTPTPTPEPDDNNNNDNNGKDRDRHDRDSKNHNHKNIDIKVIEKDNENDSDELDDIKQTIIAINYDQGAGINCVIDEDDNGKCETFSVNKDLGKEPLLVIIPFDN